MLAALEGGYRLIDTANAYVNEKGCGPGHEEIRPEAEEIFLETKLWPSFYENDDAVDKTLERLGTDTIDLLLIHQPAGNYVAGYRQMEKAYKEGKKAIGLSNFNQGQIEEILGLCQVKARRAANRGHPYFQEQELKSFLSKEGMVIQAWYPRPRGQGAAGGAPVHEAGKEVRQDQRPDYPAVAHSGREYRHPRLQEPGPHQG